MLHKVFVIIFVSILYHGVRSGIKYQYFIMVSEVGTELRTQVRKFRTLLKPHSFTRKKTHFSSSFIQK